MSQYGTRVIHLACSMTWHVCIWALATKVKQVEPSMPLWKVYFCVVATQVKMMKPPYIACSHVNLLSQSFHMAAT